jgi:hypothetical protein
MPSTTRYPFGRTSITRAVNVVSRVVARLVDPFSDKEFHPIYGELARYYSYGKVVSLSQMIVDSQTGCTPAVEMIDRAGFNEGAFKKYGFWRMVSNGPDRTYSSRAFIANDPVLLGADIIYDPSNGSVSWGNLLQTQLYGAGGGR